MLRRHRLSESPWVVPVTCSLRKMGRDGWALQLARVGTVWPSLPGVAASELQHASISFQKLPVAQVYRRTRTTCAKPFAKPSMPLGMFVVRDVSSMLQGSANDPLLPALRSRRSPRNAPICRTTAGLQHHAASKGLRGTCRRIRNSES